MATGEPFRIVALNFCILCNTVFIYKTSEHFGGFTVLELAQWDTASCTDEDFICEELLRSISLSKLINRKELHSQEGKYLISQIW